MALALPLLIPFAEAAGIAIGTLTTAAGLDILSSKVEEYIEDNPENAQKIFAMIMPEQGLASIFNKEADDGEEMSEEELGEIEKPKLTGKEKSEKIKAAIRRARGEKGLPARGNYSSPDAEGSAVDIGGSVIREVEDMGIADKDLKDNYTGPSAYTGWKKFANKYKKKYADGGIMGGNKTYHQVRDQFMPMDSESMGYANGGGVGSMMQPKKVPMQGGVQNHLGKQKMVTVPQRWQSAENHPQTELAYITKPEKNLLLKKDIHNSLNGSVNRGPEGVMSLNGWGSTDSSQNVSGAAASAAETNSSNARDRAEVRAAFAPAGPALPPGVTPKSAQDFRDAFINAGAGQRVNPGFFDSRTFLSPAEIARAKGYRNDPSNPFAKKSFRNTGQSGIMNFIRSGGMLGNLVRSLGQKFGLGKRYDDTSTSISEGFNNNLGLGGINNATYDFNPNAKINQNIDTTGSSRFSNRSLGDINTMPEVNVTGLNNNDFDGVNQPQELSMMEQYYNDIDNRATGPNIVQDASTLAQQAKTFNTIDALNSLGNTTEKGFFGTGLTDQGKALEAFRNSATNFKNTPANTNNTAQSALDFMSNRPGLYGDVIENKDFIQNAINQGFLQTEDDYTNQKSLKDFI
jgi:hypothetical protein